MSERLGKMEEEDDESRSRRMKLAAFSSLNARVVTAESASTSTSTSVRAQTSAESTETTTLSSISTAQYSDRSFVSKSTFSRSGTSSSSQEEEAAVQATLTSGQYLAAARVESARSMESLRPGKETSPARPASSCARHTRSFLTASERDVREARGLPARRALSGEDMGCSAERRRGLFAGSERRVLQQLSLPPPERRLTILSPHSPQAGGELAWPAPGIRGRRKKGMVLPKLILPRADSDGSDVFFERCIFYLYP